MNTEIKIEKHMFCGYYNKKRTPLILRLLRKHEFKIPIVLDIEASQNQNSNLQKAQGNELTLIKLSIILTCSLLF